MRIPLAIRYSFFSGLVLLVVMVVATFFHVNKVQGLFAETFMDDADALADLILRNSYHLMMEDDRRHLQLMVEEVSQSQIIDRVRILGREGVVSFSTDFSEVGTTMNMQDDSCAFCHVPGSEALIDVPIEDRTRIVAGRYMNVTRGIYNDPGCFTASCHVHPPEQEKIGVLDMAVSLEKFEKLSQVHEADVLKLIFFMLLTLVLCNGILTRKMIGYPIQSLLKQTKALSVGELSARVEALSKDEIGELGRSFNQMAESLNKAQEDIKSWASTLEHKVDERTADMAEMQEQLLRSAKLASMGQLAAGVAHEINNPLTGIMMFASLSSKNPDLPPQVKSNLDLIVAEANRCAKIVGGLLEFARESAPEKKPALINNIIEQTLDLVLHQSIFQDVEVVCRLADDIPEIDLDTDQWQQVFVNMIINAGQAMPEGGTLNVSTVYLEADKAIQIIIEDTGTGISREEIEKIFDPFFTTKSQDGTGLGLSVTYGIVKNHGGNIDVQSVEGEGTRFSIFLPVDNSEADSTADQESNASERNIS